MQLCGQRAHVPGDEWGWRSVLAPVRCLAPMGLCDPKSLLCMLLQGSRGGVVSWACFHLHPLLSVGGEAPLFLESSPRCIMLQKSACHSLMV